MTWGHSSLGPPQSRPAERLPLYHSTLQSARIAAPALDDLARAGVRFPPRLLLFRKAFLTLQGVLADVCPAAALDATLMSEVLVRLAWEWPLRWLKPLHDRDYGTHVSSADLIDLVVGTTVACAKAILPEAGAP